MILPFTPSRWCCLSLSVDRRVLSLPVHLFCARSCSLSAVALLLVVDRCPLASETLSSGRLTRFALTRDSPTKICSRPFAPPSTTEEQQQGATTNTSKRPTTQASNLHATQLNARSHSTRPSSPRRSAEPLFHKRHLQLHSSSSPPTMTMLEYEVSKQTTQQTHALEDSSKKHSRRHIQVEGALGCSLDVPLALPFLQLPSAPHHSSSSMSGCPAATAALPCYSLFAGADYPLARVCQELPHLSQQRRPSVATPASSAAALDRSGMVKPPPGFACKGAHEEEKKQLPSPATLSIQLPSQLSCRSHSPTAASESGSCTPTSASSSVSSSASSSAASSRKSSFSSAGSSPLMGATPPTSRPSSSLSIRMLSSAPEPLQLAANGAMIRTITHTTQPQQQQQQQRSGHNGRRGQTQQRRRQ